MTNETNSKLKRWQLSLKGTKFAPRQKEIIEAETLHRNKYGDLLFLVDGEIIASYNREMVIGAAYASHVRPASKKKLGTVTPIDGAN